MMPTQAKWVSRGIRVSESQSIPASLYYSVSAGKRFVAAGFYKVGGDTSPSLSLFDNFVSGMEYSLKANEKLKSLKFDRNVSLDGVHGKQYELALAEYAGVARFLESEKGFYALVVIGGDRDDRDAKRFLSSFRVGDVNTNDAVSGVANSQVVTMIGSKDSTTKAVSPNPAATPAKGVVVLATPAEENAGSTLPPEPWSESVGSITGGVLNGKAIRLVQPKYPAAARKSHDSGQVKVQIVINEIGNVVSAQALNGPESLKEAALAAAWQCRFTPTFLMGQPVKVSGVIIYNFVAQ
jgi:TonB family protein